MSKEVRSSDHAEAPIQSHEIRDVQQTTCVIVGAGPAGAVRRCRSKAAVRSTRLEDKVPLHCVYAPDSFP